MNTKRNRVYRGEELTIFWRAPLCIHATSCYRTLREVFDPAKRPWINPQGAEAITIKNVIEECPTQALMFRWNDPTRNADERSPKLYCGNFAEDFPTYNAADYGIEGELAATDETIEKPMVAGATLSFRPNGPIIVSGDFEINVEGAPLRPVKMASLCRCGASNSMPHCDGTHFKIGFKG